MKVKNDHRSKFSNLSNWKEEAWKKSGLQRDSNPWPPRYRCVALPTELWSHTLGARSIYWVHISREEWNDVKYIWNNSFFFKVYIKLQDQYQCQVWIICRLNVACQFKEVTLSYRKTFALRSWMLTCTGKALESIMKNNHTHTVTYHRMLIFRNSNTNLTLPSWWLVSVQFHVTIHMTRVLKNGTCWTLHPVQPLETL